MEFVGIQLALLCLLFLGLGTNELEQNLCSLYVGNVAFEAEESHFRELFAKFDPKDIRIKQEMYVL